MADTYKDVPVRSVDISSPFWAHMRECSRQKTIPAIIKAQKLSGHWQCLTWKEGDDHEIHVSGSLVPSGRRLIECLALLGQRHIQDD
jgi:hypothetical protein